MNELNFGETTIELKNYSTKHFNMRGFETEDGHMWLILLSAIQNRLVNIKNGYSVLLYLTSPRKDITA